MGCRWQVHHPEAPHPEAPRTGVPLQDPSHPVWTILQAQKSQLTLKAVPLTCLPEGPVVEKLIAKVIIGQELPELATKDTSFTAQVRMPAHCIHALVTRGI